MKSWPDSIRGRFARWEVVVEPDRDEAEWWAGAPSVVRDDDGVFWMAARMRTADSPLGMRGYEIRILRSEDGIRFQPAHSIRREDVPIAGFERPALLRDPATGAFRLYGCGPIDGAWRIVRFEDAVRPDAFVPSSAHVVIEPLPREPLGPALPTQYKDPVVAFVHGAFHCWAIGVLGNERLFHFVSMDGEKWKPVGHPSSSLLPLSGWHTHSVRPASLLPVGIGWLFVYEGSSSAWDDPSYNNVTGLAFTFDLHTLVDLTPDEPLLVSPTPGRLQAWRYSHWMWVGDELRVYAEVEKANGAHEIRLFRVTR